MTVTRKDSDIQKDILAELKWEPQVKETDIGVIVKNGAVTLTGTVPSYMDKLSANRAARRINGVRAIADEMEVKLPYEMAGTDEDIAQHIIRAFNWNTQIPDTIKAEVRDGIVTLTGAVDWQFQRDAAQNQVDNIQGVKSVINDIELRKRVAERDVKSKIESALHRYANTAASKINVTVNGSTVTLNGDVHNYAEIDMIRNAAWAAPGVTRVVDLLQVA